MRIKVEIELRRPSRRVAALLLGVVLLALPSVVLAGHHFSDVPSGHPFHDQIGAIAKAGITGGFSDGTYRPSDPVTRQAMAAFMHRGFGRVGLAIDQTPMTTSVSVGVDSSTSVYVPVRQVTIAVPGASNAFSPAQLVHLQGRVHLVAEMNAAQGCPCEFSARIRDMTTNTVSVAQHQTFESSSAFMYFRSFDVEALFATTPGPRTFQLEVRLSYRDNFASAASFGLAYSSSLSATTFPFGPTGSNTTTAPGAANEPAAVDQLPERRRNE